MMSTLSGWLELQEQWRKEEYEETEDRDDDGDNTTVLQKGQ